MRKTILVVVGSLLALALIVVSCVSEPGTIQAPCECEFMTIAGFVQALSGKTLSSNELAELLKTATTVPVIEKNGTWYPMVDAKTYKVRDRTVLSKYLFTYIGWKEVWLEFGSAKNTENFVGFLGEYKRADGSIHYAIYNKEKRCLWNYHSEDSGIEPTTLIEVYVRSAK